MAGGRNRGDGPGPAPGGPGGGQGQANQEQHARDRRKAEKQALEAQRKAELEAKRIRDERLRQKHEALVATEATIEQAVALLDRHYIPLADTEPALVQENIRLLRETRETIQAGQGDFQTLEASVRAISEELQALERTAAARGIDAALQRINEILGRAKPENHPTPLQNDEFIINNRNRRFHTELTRLKEQLEELNEAMAAVDADHPFTSAQQRLMRNMVQRAMPAVRAAERGINGSIETEMAEERAALKARFNPIIQRAEQVLDLGFLHWVGNRRAAIEGDILDIAIGHQAIIDNTTTIDNTLQQGVEDSANELSENLVIEESGLLTETITHLEGQVGLIRTATVPDPALIPSQELDVLELQLGEAESQATAAISDGSIDQPERRDQFYSQLRRIGQNLDDIDHFIQRQEISQQTPEVQPTPQPPEIVTINEIVAGYIRYQLRNERQAQRLANLTDQETIDEYRREIEAIQSPERRAQRLQEFEGLFRVAPVLQRVGQRTSELRGELADHLSQPGNRLLEHSMIRLYGWLTVTTLAANTDILPGIGHYGLQHLTRWAAPAGWKAEGWSWQDRGVGALHGAMAGFTIGSALGALRLATDPIARGRMMFQHVAHRYHTEHNRTPTAGQTREGAGQAIRHYVRLLQGTPWQGIITRVQGMNLGPEQAEAQFRQLIEQGTQQNNTTITTLETVLTDGQQHFEQMAAMQNPLSADQQVQFYITTLQQQHGLLNPTSYPARQLEHLITNLTGLPGQPTPEQVVGIIRQHQEDLRAQNHHGQEVIATAETGRDVHARRMTPEAAQTILQGLIDRFNALLHEGGTPQQPIAPGTLRNQKEEALHLVGEMTQMQEDLEWYQAVASVGPRPANESVQDYNIRVFANFCQRRAQGSVADERERQILVRETFHSHLPLHLGFRNTTLIDAHIPLPSQPFVAATLRAGAQWVVWGAGVGAIVPPMAWTPIAGFMACSARALTRIQDRFSWVDRTQERIETRALQLEEETEAAQEGRVSEAALRPAIVSVDQRIFRINASDVKSSPDYNDLKARWRVERDRLVDLHGYFFLGETPNEQGGTRPVLGRLWPAPLERGLARPQNPDPHKPLLRDPARLADRSQITDGTIRTKELDLEAMIAHYDAGDQYRPDPIDSSSDMLNTGLNPNWPTIKRGHDRREVLPLDASSIYIAGQADDPEAISQVFIHPAAVGEFVFAWAKMRDQLSVQEFVRFYIRAQRNNQRVVLSRHPQTNDWQLFVV